MSPVDGALEEEQPVTGDVPATEGQAPADEETQPAPETQVEDPTALEEQPVEEALPQETAPVTVEEPIA